MDPEIERLLPLAIQTCFSYEVKKEIISAETYLQLMRMMTSDELRGLSPSTCRIHRIDCLKNIIDSTAGLELGSLSIEEKEKLLGLVYVIANKMRTWALFHEENIGISSDYIIELLDSTHFTNEGVIDYRKLCTQMVDDITLTIDERYRIACLYCMRSKVSELHKLIFKPGTERYYDDEGLQEANLIKYWSYYMMGEEERLNMGTGPYRYTIIKAIEIGNLVAVENCLSTGYITTRKNILVDAALLIVGILSNPGCLGYNMSGPYEFYVDLLFYMISKMSESQILDLLKKDTQGKYGIHKASAVASAVRFRPAVLAHCLNWPYQHYIMAMMRRIWENETEMKITDSYAAFLRGLVDRSRLELGHEFYGDDKTYDYRRLFRELWCDSPEDYKKFVFTEKKVLKPFHPTIILNYGAQILLKILLHKARNEKDIENFRIFTKDLKDQEKTRVLHSAESKKICLELFESGQWELLDEFIGRFSTSEENATDFKKAFCYLINVQSKCLTWAEYGNFESVEHLFRWSSMCGAEQSRLKKLIFYFDNNYRNIETFMEYFHIDGNMNKIKQLCEWALETEDERQLFKRNLLSPSKAVQVCVSIFDETDFQDPDEFFAWCLNDDLRDFKRTTIYNCAGTICDTLMFHVVVNSQGKTVYSFSRDHWLSVVKFVTWAFETEEQIKLFKKRFHAEFGLKNHLNFIRCNKFAHAKKFFKWLGLSADEVQSLKRRTFMDYGECIQEFRDLIFGLETPLSCVYSGTLRDKVQLLLSWFLTDEDSLLCYRQRILSAYKAISDPVRREAFNEVLIAIDNCMEDLRQL